MILLVQLLLLLQLLQLVVLLLLVLLLLLLLLAKGGSDRAKLHAASTAATCDAAKGEARRHRGAHALKQV